MQQTEHNLIQNVAQNNKHFSTQKFMELLYFFCFKL